MAKKHPGKYRVRAARHLAAARKSKGNKAKGHREIAAGYYTLARGSESYKGYQGFGGRRTKKRKHKRAKKKGKR